MRSTLVYSKEGKLIVTKTLRSTAIAMTDMRGAFHVNDILFALKSQGIESITAEQVRSQLYYDGSFSTGRARKGTFHMLKKLDAGWFTWQKIEYNPHPDESKGEIAFKIVG